MMQVPARWGLVLQGGTLMGGVASVWHRSVCFREERTLSRGAEASVVLREA